MFLTIVILPAPLASTQAPPAVVLVRLLVGALFLLILGAGACSLDARLYHRAACGQQTERPSSQERH